MLPGDAADKTGDAVQRTPITGNDGLWHPLSLALAPPASGSNKIQGEPAMDEFAPRPLHYAEALEVIRRRRSVRRFEKGRSVPRETLLQIAEFGRSAPTGANAQWWDLVIVDEPEMRQKVLDVFLRQSQRLVDHAKGFPAVKKTYLANTVAIFIVLGDPRWKACFPQATSPEWPPNTPGTTSGSTSFQSGPPCRTSCSGSLPPA